MIYIIGGKFKKRALYTPKTEEVRPTTSQLREALFNICQHTIAGASFLDLFAGSGAMGLEALSREAARSTFIDNNRLALTAIKKNIETLKVETETQILNMEVSKGLQLLEKRKERFEIIYADPPYGKGYGAYLLTFLDTHTLLAPGGTLFIEEADLQIPPLQNLQLKSQRKVGRATLSIFTY